VEIEPLLVGRQRRQPLSKLAASQRERQLRRDHPGSPPLGAQFHTGELLAWVEVRHPLATHPRRSGIVITPLAQRADARLAAMVANPLRKGDR